MTDASPAIRDLARRLIAQEAGRDQESEIMADAALSAVNRLRLPLSRLSGIEGFRSLLSRAVTLAKAKFPELGLLQIRADGSIERLDEIQSKLSIGESGEAEAVLLVELLWLLITFVGEAFTLQLLREIWPDASLDTSKPEEKEIRQ